MKRRQKGKGNKGEIERRREREELTGNTAESLQAGQLPDNNIAINHGLRTSSHGNRQDKNQRHRQRTDGHGHSIDDHITPSAKLVRREHNNSANDSDAKDVQKQPRQLSLQRSSDSDTEEGTNDAHDDLEAEDDVGPESNLPLGVLVRVDPASRRRLAEGSGDETDLSTHTRSENNTASATLGDDSRAESDVDAVTRTSVIVKGHLGILPDRQRFTSEQGLVGLEVDGLDETHIGGDGVTHLELDDVAGDDLGGIDDDGLTLADDLGGGGGQGAEGVDGAGGLVVLEEADDDVEEDDGGEHAAFDPCLDTETGCQSQNEDLW